MGHVQKPGIAGLFYCCYFFYIGGILSLPYQFYHHAHKMQCDHGQIFFFFLSDTDHHRVTLSECAYGSPRCATLCTLPTRTPSPSILSNSEWYIRFDALSPVAVVMIGKGHTRQAQSQIKGMVSNGKRPGHQAKSTNGFRTVSTGSGKDW